MSILQKKPSEYSENVVGVLTKQKILRGEYSIVVLVLVHSYSSTSTTVEYSNVRVLMSSRSIF